MSTLKNIISSICLGFLYLSLSAQPVSVIVNVGTLEGIEITPQNVFNYSIVNNEGRSKDVLVKGSLIYRNSPLRFTYSYKATLQPGMNSFSRDIVHDPQWFFSSTGLQELFFTYGKLPQGTYEYCVEVGLDPSKIENPYSDPVDGCIYYTVNDIFLINLVTPENDAKLYEYYPMLGWVVNYPFASELTYRVRVAELKEGQNNENAITRNNPVFQESNVFATGITYPVTAKPLQVFQPYVWTVDAYYKGILLGGAEVWKFTIIEDSLLEAVSAEQAYYDFVEHKGDTRLYAVGAVKLKYKSEQMNDTLFIRIFNEKGKEINYSQKELPLRIGDNRIDIDLFDKARVNHRKKYVVEVTTKKQKQYRVPFMYINPRFINE